MGIFTRRNRTGSISNHNNNNNVTEHILEHDIPDPFAAGYNDGSIGSRARSDSRSSVNVTASSTQPLTSSNINNISGTPPGLRKKSSKLSLHSLSNEESTRQRSYSRLHNLVASSQDQEGSPNDKIRQLNFGIGIPEIDNTSTTGSDTRLLTANNTGNSTAPSLSSPLHLQKKPRRKISVTELNHIRNHSVTSSTMDIPSFENQHFFSNAPINAVNSNANMSIASSNISEHRSQKSIAQSQQKELPPQPTEQHHQSSQKVQPQLNTKKSFTFFNRLMKPNKNKSNNNSNDATASNAAAERYASNSQMEIVQTNLSLDDMFNDTDMLEESIRDKPLPPIQNQDNNKINQLSQKQNAEDSAPISQQIMYRKRPIESAPDSRLSTLTEDSFYFNSRVPTTPVYAASGGDTGSRITVNGKEKFLASTNEGFELPLNEDCNGDSYAPEQNDNNDDEPLHNKLLPPIGDDINEKPGVHSDDEDEDLKISDGFKANEISNKTPATLKTTPGATTASSPASASSKLSRIISRMSLGGITSPKSHRNSLISSITAGNTNGKSSKSSTKNKILRISVSDSLYNEPDFDNIAQKTSQEQGKKSQNDSREFITADDIPLSSPNVLKDNSATPGIRTPTIPDNESGKASDTDYTGESNNLPTPTVGSSQYFEMLMDEKPKNSDLNNEILTPGSQQADPIGDLNESSPVENSNTTTPGEIKASKSESQQSQGKTSHSLFRSPTRRLSKRLSGKFSSSPLVSFYKSASPKRFSPLSSNNAAANGDTSPLDAINVPELSNDINSSIPSSTPAESENSSSAKSQASSSDNAEIIETAIVAKKVVGVSPVKVNFSQSNDPRERKTNQSLPYNQLKATEPTDYSNAPSSSSSIALSIPVHVDNNDVPKSLGKIETTNDFLAFDDSIEDHNYTQLSPIEEVDSPQSARIGRGMLSAAHRDIPSITSSLSKLAGVDMPNANNNLMIGDRGSGTASSSSGSGIASGSFTVLKEDETTDYTPMGSKSSLKSTELVSSNVKSIKQNDANGLDHHSMISRNNVHGRNQQITNDDTAAAGVISSDQNPRSKAIKAQSKLSETFTLNDLEHQSQRNASTDSIDGKSKANVSFGESDTSMNSLSVGNVRVRKPRSPRTMTSYQEDFLTRSAKTLSTISVSTNKRNTLRPISATFRTPLLPDYEDDVDQTPILPTDGKNNSQITLNFAEKPIREVIDEKDLQENSPARINEMAGMEESNFDNINDIPKILEFQKNIADVTQNVPPELVELLQKEGFNDFTSPKSVDINYENFVQSDESSTRSTSEFEFATDKDYSKNKKLDFAVRSIPIEMSKDPIFANILNGNESNPSSSEVDTIAKSPSNIGSIEVYDVAAAPKQPKYPPPVPGSYHPTIAEESENESPVFQNGDDSLASYNGPTAKTTSKMRSNSNSDNPFIDNGNITAIQNYDGTRSSMSLPRKSSQLSLNKILYSNANAMASTVSDFDGNTIQISNSNSNRTLTKGFSSPTTSPFKRSTQLKHSNSLRLVTTTPRAKDASNAKTPETDRKLSNYDTSELNQSMTDYSMRSPDSLYSANSSFRHRASSVGSPKHKPSLSNSTTDSIYQEVYGNLKLRDGYRSDLSLNAMKKSPSITSLDLKGYHRSRHFSSDLHTDSSIDLSFFQSSEESNELASLFIKAIHTFDATSLESEDSAICLSFEKDDIAFVFNIDESGWGEVVLLSNLSKGWVPMNYFNSAIDDSHSEDNKSAAKIAESRIYLKPLFVAAAGFLLNPQEVPTGDAGLFTFSTKHMNDIRDGVKLLLQQTDCISRAAPIVNKRPVIRKVRKALLADWYTLMSKAEKYKGTTDETKINFLKSLTYKVLIKGLAFLDIWGDESVSYEKEKEKLKIEKKNRRRSKRGSKHEKVLYLERVPFAVERLEEVKDLLFKYLSLILGRLDVVENNYSGCEQLESIIHQVILLLRELLFIGKSATVLLNSSNISLDSSLDNLLAYVSDLVTSVKHLVAKADVEDDYDDDYEPSIKDEDYYYSKEGTKLIRVVAQMIISVSKAMGSCQQLLNLTKDFQLNIYRKYPDFESMRITPTEFIRKCVVGLTENQSIHYKLNGVSDLSTNRRSSASFRYSHIRGGSKKNLSITFDGSRILKEFLSNSDSDPRDSVIPITNEEYDSEYSVDTLMKEVVYDDNKNVIGASFKSLVFLLANERTHASTFFISTFFMSFRNFASTRELIHELIKRFDIGDREKDFLMRNYRLRVNEVSVYDSRLMNRRKTILAVIRIWLESYWDYEKDFSELPTMVNFLNEGAIAYVPNESLTIIELCARLAIKHPSKKKLESMNSEYSQLISRRIGLPRKNSVGSESSTSLISASDSEHDLSSLSSNSSMSSLVSLNLPMNFSNYHISTIMSKSQGATLEKSVAAFRNILGDSWPTPRSSSADYSANGKLFQTLELNQMIDAWFSVCSKKLNIEPPAVATELTSHNAVDTAKQLTDIESRIFLAIRPEELLDENFREKRIHLKKSVNVEKSVLFTNLLSDLVSDTILSPGQSMKARVANIKQWLKIAAACYQLRNYNSLAAIMTVLQLSAISRLDRLWASLSGKYMDTFEFLVKIIHPNKNYKVYRNLIKPYMMSEDKKSPMAIVPYFNLFLQDIIFANDGNRSKRIITIDGEEKSLINFDKHSKIVDTISKLEYFQVTYPEGDANNSTNASSSSSKPSVFSFSPISNNESYDTIVSNPAFEEFILFKLWATQQFNILDYDRFWKYSLEIQPQNNSN
ncbi:Ras family guanine nucleotide exchange factor [Saccharomycopsis crataegensis]|uniref:Ras family guanine nucleotide exchange factor n=1 Tax=Saccharomycopsis crataegensis TaxID=43959 RepID=A0AAV5QWP9_9ASCO|nr:Ras family guanine nucleotide exchange factor [Saccharomycopsis crataegensis]